jgi:amidohydrolase
MSGQEAARLVRWRRDLHRIPELAYAEKETSAYLLRALAELGLTGQRIADTGVAVDIGDAAEPVTVMWRADIDGLPLTEATGLAFASRHPGVMHACGHDGHAAIALGLAARLLAHPVRGRVRIVFQPAEEQHPGGALPLIREGILDGVDAVLGLHLWTSLPTGSVALTPGPMTAFSDRFVLNITGRGGHGSSPHDARDAVTAAAAMVMAVQTVVSRRIAPHRPAVVTCGQVTAGQAPNIIAETAEIRGTVRTTDENTRQAVEELLAETVAGTAAVHRVAAVLDYRRGYPAVDNHPDVVHRWRDALPGDLRQVAWNPALVGEDFAYYLRERPGAFAMVGARAADGFRPHHAPTFDFAEEALLSGLEVAWAGVTAWCGV